MLGCSTHLGIPPIWGFNPMGISGGLTPFPSRRVRVRRVNGCGRAFAPVLPSVLVRSFLRFDIFTRVFLTSFRADRALRTVMSIDERGSANAVYGVNRPILGRPNCFSDSLALPTRASLCALHRNTYLLSMDLALFYAFKVSDSWSIDAFH